MNVFMEEMSWQDFNSRKSDTVVFLPVGSTEQHGPMLPLSVDTIISTELAKIVAEKINGIVAPSICYGYKSAPLSGGGPLFPGTLDLNGNTLVQLVYDVLEELIRDGIKKLFVMNGHYENEPFILEAVDLISRKYDDVTIIESSWFGTDIISEEVMEKVFDEVEFPGWALEHAGIAETSLMMHFRPDLVDMSKFVEDEPSKELGYALFPASKCSVPKTGLLTTARSSSPEKGELLAESIRDSYIEIINKILGR